MNLYFNYSKYAFVALTEQQRNDSCTDNEYEIGLLAWNAASIFGIMGYVLTANTKLIPTSKVPFSSVSLHTWITSK